MESTIKEYDDSSPKSNHDYGKKLEEDELILYASFIKKKNMMILYLMNQALQ